ncbi:MAG: hypothetical protein HY606_07355 [Planctomycetes bacterium]|nr:hypothetical protein [Planctomycetota bacterium]
MNVIIWITTADSKKFYNEDPEKFYAISRLFCYYLQEKKLLMSFYTTFNRLKSDRYGVDTLKRLLGKEINEIDADFKSWVTKTLENVVD